MGAFGLSVPAEYGGYSDGGRRVPRHGRRHRGAVAGLARHRRLAHHPPEILTRPLVRGGTEDQKHEWLPKLATAEVMAAVAVTEPDFGSDVAGIKVTATPADGRTALGLRHQRRQDVVHVRARADVLMLLARTDPDRAKATAGCRSSSCPSRAARATASS
jgi:(2S)-methylsuccinyl-CoA dehydrogenase